MAQSSPSLIWRRDLLWSSLCWSLLLPSAGGAPLACGNLIPGAKLFHAALDRCLQRCRDTLGGDCEQVAYDSGSMTCALGATASFCGGGSWVQHNPNPEDDCGFGRGKATSSMDCIMCLVGTASHPEVGDLAGIWRLSDESGANAGRIIISTGGVADFMGVADSIETRIGQFVLWHTRHDSNYPGAFFLQHRVEPGEGGANWDYAWIEEEDTVGNVRLVLRRFCGKGPLLCPKTSSPEGSPSFEKTLIGVRESGSEPPCEILEGVSVATGSQNLGMCCLAASAVSQAVDNQDFVADIVIAGAGPWDNLALVHATWNQPPFHNLAGAHLTLDSSNLKLCSSVSNGTLQQGRSVMIAERGDCSFTEKANAAFEAGAVGIIIANVQGKALPQTLLSDQTSPIPKIPAWMIDVTAGGQIISALQQQTDKTGTVSSIDYPEPPPQSSVQDICCAASCLDRVSLATAEGRGGGINVSIICPAVDCAGYVPGSAPASQPVSLPHSTAQCQQCPDGLATAVPGSASCTSCGDGQTSLDGRSCGPCPEGTAGTFGRCTECGTGRVADVSRRQCILLETAPTPATPPPTPTPTAPPPATNTVSTPVRNSGSGSSGGGGGGGGTTIVQTTDFNWGALIVIVICILIVCGGCWLFRKAFLHMQESGGEANWQNFGQSAVTVWNSSLASAKGERRAERGSGDGNDAEAGAGGGSSSGSGSNTIGKKTGATAGGQTAAAKAKSNAAA